MKKHLLSLALLVLCGFSYAQLTLSSTLKHVSCAGGANGSATVAVSGGTPAYSYTWMPTMQTGSVAVNLGPGQYTVWAEDAAAATGSAVVSITEPSPLTIAGSQANLSCNAACTGTASVFVTGGTSPYAYAWTSTGSVIPAATNLCAGIHQVSVTDSKGCVITQTFSITQPSAMIVTPFVSLPSCFGACDGSANVSVTGGNSPYSYLWTANSSTLNAISNQCAGPKPLRVLDASGCVKNQTITISQPQPLTGNITHTNVSCNGSCDGKVIVSSTGGIPPYQITWSNGSTASAITNICTGNYSVTITDSHACVTSSTVTVAQSPSLTASMTTTNVSCNGTCNGSAYINVAGGAGVYTFSSQPAGITSANPGNLCAGIYTVYISDVSGCSYVLPTSISQAANPLISITTASSVCGQCNGSAHAIASGGISPYTYTWSQGANSSSVANVCAGIYGVTVNDALGCTSTRTVSVGNSGGLALQNATLSSMVYQETCLQTGDGGIDLMVGGSNPGPFTYQWSNGSTSQDLANIPSGGYTVTVFDANAHCAVLASSVTPNGANCGSISGNVFMDNNGDCVKNGGDNDYAGAMIIVNPGNRMGFTNTLGNYTVNNLPFGSYSVTTAPNTNSSITSTCTASINTTLNTGTVNAVNNNFGLQQTFSSQPDMYGWAGSGGVVPGFVSRITYVLRNYQLNGAGLFKARVPFNFIGTITAVSPANFTISGDTVIWNYNNISHLNSATFYIDFVPPVNTPLGSTFTTCATATTILPDLNPPNNSFCYSRIVTGSYDPNDKAVSPVGVGAEGNITVNEKELNYLIRFQNTGNGPAVNIVVKDTLSAFVDVTTLQILSVSHNYKIDILPGNILRWKFDNIMLPDSNSNEPASHGYIQYRIRQKANNALGTEIKNTAYIYFDFNDPVVTNTALNTIWEPPVGIETLGNVNDNWLVYPNPATNILYVRNGSAPMEGATQLELMNAMGQVLYTERFTGNAKAIDLSGYASGVYFVKLVTEERSTMKRIVIAK